MKNLPGIIDPKLLKQLIEGVFANNPDATGLLIQVLLNKNYDFNTKTGYYSILSEEEWRYFEYINKIRREDPEIDKAFQLILISISVSVSIGYLVFLLIRKSKVSATIDFY